MKSLRRGLTLWLWTTLGVVGISTAIFAVLQARRETQFQVDYQMQQVANIVANQPLPQEGSITQATRNVEIEPSIHVHHDEDDDILVTVRDSSDRLLYVSPANRRLPGHALPSLGELGFHTLTVGHESFRVFVARARGLKIQVAQSVEVIEEAEGGIALAALAPIALLLPILAIVLGFAIRRQLRPLNTAARAIADRAALSLDPLPTAGLPSEVQPLIDEFNRLLLRLGTAVEREQQFVTDAAHALRTPLTALQLQAEILDGGDSPDERAIRLRDLRAGIRRIIRLSEQLLSLARSQSETGKPITTTIELDPALREIGAFYTATARGKQIDIRIDAQSGAQVLGNSRRMTLIVGNLLDNAIRFSPAGGRIDIRASSAAGLATVEVSDEGCGMPPGELEHAFERFRQGVGVDGNGGSGSGLGLATVEALVKQVGGRVHLENRSDRSGLLAIVTLPLAVTPPPNGAMAPGLVLDGL